MENVTDTATFWKYVDEMRSVADEITELTNAVETAQNQRYRAEQALAGLEEESYISEIQAEVTNFAAEITEIDKKIAAKDAIIKNTSDNATDADAIKAEAQAAKDFYTARKAETQTLYNDNLALYTEMRTAKDILKVQQ